MIKVSIIIPVYNGANYVAEAIESALAQTYQNKEIIVVNDGSNDDGATREKVKAFGDQVIYYEKENGGVSSALNLGIKKATGDYISWLSHDDLYYPNKLERQVEELKKYDDHTILYSNVDMIDMNGKVFDTILYDHEMLEKKPDYALLKSLISGITLLIPKKAFEECGLFDEKLRCVQDYQKWFEFLGKYKFVHMKDVLGASRVHPKQVTYTSPKMITEGNWLWSNMIENYPKEKKIEYEGSEYLFYKEMENSLQSTPYKEAVSKAHELAEKCLEEAKKNSKNQTITVIVLDNEKEEDIEKTINSLKKQTLKDFVIEKESFNNIDKALKKVKTDYYTMINAGVTAKEEWLEKQLLIAAISNKSVIISDYKRPLRSGTVDNYCSFLTPLDGIIFKKSKDIPFKNTYQFILDNAMIQGSITSEDKFLENIKESYNMDEVFEYQRKVIELNKSTSYQLASLNYDISVIYNHYATDGKKVFMYEPCDEYKELMYSRTFQIYKKYYDYKKKRKKKL